MFFHVDLLTTAFSNCNTGDIRLVNGSSPLEGRLEICINNAWGTVCHDSFSKDDAEVACRQLGNITGKHFFHAVKSVCIILISDADRVQEAKPVADIRFGSGTGPIFLNQLNCRGDESGILSCGSPLYVHHCTHKEDAGVICPGKYYGKLKRIE